MVMRLRDIAVPLRVQERPEVFTYLVFDCLTSAQRSLALTLQ